MGLSLDILNFALEQDTSIAVDPVDILGDALRQDEQRKFEAFRKAAPPITLEGIELEQRGDVFIPRFTDDEEAARQEIGEQQAEQISEVRAKQLERPLNEFVDLGTEAGRALQRGTRRTASDLILGTPEIAARTFIEVLRSQLPEGALENEEAIKQLPLIARGVLEVAASAGITADQLNEFRKAIEERAEKEFPRSEELKNIKLEDLGLQILNPANPEARRLFVAFTAETVPMFASTIGTGVALKAAGASRLATAAGAGSVGAFQESVNTFDEAKRRGATETEALEKFAAVFASTAVLDAIGINFILSKLPKGVAGKITSVAASGFAEGVTEDLQETIQGLVVGDSVKQALLQGLAAFGPGAFLGGGARAAIVSGDVDLTSRAGTAKLLGIPKDQLPPGLATKKQREEFVDEARRMFADVEPIDVPPPVEPPPLPEPEPIVEPPPLPEPEPTVEPERREVDTKIDVLKDLSEKAKKDVDVIVDQRKEQLSVKTNKELNQIARDHGLKQLGGLKKSVLVERIIEDEFPTDEKPTEVTQFKVTDKLSIQNDKGQIPKTGQPITIDTFHGTGRPEGESVLAEDVEENVLGEALYSALTAKDALLFGPKIESRKVTLQNPYVLTNNNQLSELAGGRQIPLRNSERGQFLRDVREELDQRGHDGVVVILPTNRDFDASGKSFKRVREIFGGSQIIEFKPKSVEPKLSELAEPEPPTIAEIPAPKKKRTTSEQLIAESPALDPDPNTGVVFAPTRAPETAMQLEQVLPPVNHMPMREKPPKGWKKTESAQNVFKAFENILTVFGEETGINVVIRVGRVFKRRALGQFNLETFVIRLRVAHDMTTATHEIGHAIDSLMFRDRLRGKDQRAPKQKPDVFTTHPRPKGVKEELIALGKNLYPKRRPDNGYESEGIAEYVRVLLLDPTNAPNVAPKFNEWFHKEFLEIYPKAAKAIIKAQDAVTTWQDQGAVLRGLKNIVETDTALDRAQKFKFAIEKGFGFESVFEGLAPMWDYARAIEKITGKPVAFKDNPYFNAKAFRGTHDARAERMIEDGMINAIGQEVGPSLRQAISLARRQEKKITVYLYALRSEASWLGKKKVIQIAPDGTEVETFVANPRDPGISLDDAQAIIRTLQSKEFDIVAQLVWDWSDGVLNYAAEFSPTFAKQVEKIRDRDVGRYVPLARIFTKLEKKAFNVSRGTSTGTSGLSGESLVKRFIGSGRAIENLFDVMMDNARSTIRAAHNRFIFEQVLALAKAFPGVGSFIEEVPPGKEAAYVTNVKRLVEEIKKVAKKADSDVLETFDDIDFEDIGTELVTFYATAKTQRERPGEKIFTVKDDDGKIRVFVVDADLYNSLDRLDSLDPSARSWITWLMMDVIARPSKRIFTLGTTGLNPSFALAVNIIRDVPSLMVHTQSSANPFRIMYSWSRAMRDGFWGLTSNESPSLKLWLNLGGSISTQFGLDRAITRQFRKKLFQGRIIRTIDPRNTFDMMRKILQVPEGAPRIVEMELVAEKLGITIDGPKTIAQANEILLAGKESTTDFSAHGSDRFIRNLVSMIPFMNASLQGPRTSVRAAQRTPKTFYRRGLMLTAATLAIWWKQKDEEWYRQMNPVERTMFTHWDFGDEILRLPRPFEVGALFMAMPEAIMDAWYRKDPEMVTEFMMVTAKTMDPVFAEFPAVPSIPIVEETIEQLANRDFFWGTDIVPQGQLRLKGKEEQQVSIYSTQAAIFLGELFGVSPRRIDHLIRGIGGSVMPDILEIIGLGTPEDLRKDELSDLPIVGRLFVRGGTSGTSSRAVNELYDEVGLAQAEQADKREPETPEERVRRLMLEDAVRAISDIADVEQVTPQTKLRRAMTRERTNIAENALRGRRLELNATTEGYIHRQIRRFTEPKVKERRRDESDEDFAARKKEREANRRRARNILLTVEATSDELIALHRRITKEKKGFEAIKARNKSGKISKFKKDTRALRRLDSNN